MEKYGFVYIWYDRKHKRYYIGSHWGLETDGYVCSSSWLKKAKKNRPNDFKRRIISKVYTSKKDLLIEENRWLSMIKPNEIKTRYYNLRIHEFGHWSVDKNLEQTTKERISQKTKEAMARPEVKEKYEAGLKTRNTRSSDSEVRAKRSVSMLGKNKGNWSKAIQISAELRCGTNISDEHKNKITQAGVFKKLNSSVVTCVHCGTKGNPGNIGRYHNDRCKSKLINNLSNTG